jgi:bacillithiol biosynthesis deacetylase BshB1
MVDILAVGAHPDDVEIAIGGTLLKMIDRGHSVLLCHATDGEPTPAGTHETRLGEAECAAKKMGAEHVVLDLPNRYLLDTIENRIAIAGVIRKNKPKMLLCPYPGGVHPDHKKISEVVDAARFYGKLTKTDPEGKEWQDPPWWTPMQFYYMGLGIHREGVFPSFIVDITDTYRRKMEVLSCYRSQFSVELDNLPPHDHWGPMIGARYGEAFFSRQPLGIDDLFAIKKYA